MTACNPNPGDSDLTPVADDFNISSLVFIHDGSPKSVTITPKENKSNGAITVKYNGSTTAPSVIGTYTVTFDVAATTGWEAVTGLSAGTLTIFDALNDIASISTYLSAQSEGTITTNPISLPVALNLGNMNSFDSNWRQLLTAINTADRYVNLDLSACTLLDDGTAFGYSNFDSYNPIQAGGLNKTVSITLPDTATSIGLWVFKNCTSLRYITLPDGLTQISSAAFEGCMNLNSITLDAATNVFSGAFAGCTNLIFTVTGSGSLSIIDNGKGLVKDNTELVAYPSASGNFTLPAVITSISRDAFRGCTGLTSITLPANTNTPSAYGTFAGCTSLSFTLTGTGSLSTLESGKILVRNGTELVAYPSASGNITTLPEGITIIGNGTFEGCTSLTSITLPEGITSIGQSAFEDCTSLTSITLPASLTSIDFNAFSNCTSLALTCNATTPPTLAAIVFYPSPSAIKVPAGSVAAYKTATNWSAYASKIVAIE